MSDQSTGQPSPVSLSPTPPSTPSPYGFGYPQGYATISSPGQVAQMVTTPSLSSPPSLAGTLTKARPVPKPPRQRPNLPPPQPPTTPGTSPQPLDHSTGLLDGLSPGESMSTGKVIEKQPSIYWLFERLARIWDLIIYIYKIIYPSKHVWAFVSDFPDCSHCLICSCMSRVVQYDSLCEMDSLG